jgi:hypothetical protein
MVFLAFVFKHVFENVACPLVSITCRDLGKGEIVGRLAMNYELGPSSNRLLDVSMYVLWPAVCAHQRRVCVIHSAEGTSDSA